MAKATQETEIILSYSLFDLPSAQHKAGLAGLLLLIDSLRQRGTDLLPDISQLSATGVKLTFTSEFSANCFRRPVRRGGSRAGFYIEMEWKSAEANRDRGEAR